jgi:hypothetical protein
MDPPYGPHIDTLMDPPNYQDLLWTPTPMDPDPYGPHIDTRTPYPTTDPLWPLYGPLMDPLMDPLWTPYGPD